MIGSIRHKGLKRLYEDGDPRGIGANWRITFRFEDGYAEDVNLEDYH